jgi:hypothetical protein
MAARPMITVEFLGPLADLPDLRATIDAALSEGIGELTDAGRDIAKEFAPSKTGRFRHGIAGLHAQGKLVGIVRQTDTYGRGTAHPTSTWLEKGTRGGVKLRRGKGIFTTAYRRINAIDKDTYFLGKMSERLGGGS